MTDPTEERMYDAGGYLPSGLRMVVNESPTPVRVLSQQGWDYIRRMYGKDGESND